MESSRKFSGFSFVFLFCVVFLYKPARSQDFLRPLYVRADEFGTDYFKPQEAKVGPTKSRFHVESLLRLESELVGLSELILNTERKIHAKEALTGDNHTHKYDEEFKFLEEMRDISDAQTVKSEEMIANPLAMFPVRKRLSVEWPDIMKNITSCSMVSDYASIENHFETILEHLLADADLTSAFEDLLRIQKTYKIPVSSLARGWLYTAKSDPLSLTDIITIAHHCLDKEDMEGAVEWLLQVAKFVKSSKLQSSEKAIYLNILGGAYLRLNKLQESKMVYGQILKDDPTSKIAQANLKLIEEKIKAQAKASTQKDKQKVEKKGKRRRKVEEDDEEKKDNSIYEQWWMRYCRGDYPKNQVEESKLMCYVRHFKHGNQSYNVEVLNRYPPMVLVHDFIGNFTAWKMMERAENELKERIQRYSQEEEASSVIQFGGDTPWLDSFVHKLRNVTYPFLTDTYEYVLMDNFRIYNVAAGGTSNPLRGEHYIGPKNTGYERFLMGRAFFILKEPEVGGSVVFPYLKVDVQPKKGDALFFQFRTPKSYSHSNFGLRFECPVALGEMWYAEQAIEHHGMIDYIPFMFQEPTPGDVIMATNDTAAEEAAAAEAAAADAVEEGNDEKEAPVKKTTKTKSTATPSTKSSSTTKKTDTAKKASTEKKSTGTGKTTTGKSTKKTVKK